ncbi:hypothetical protein IR083_21030 [Dysgonomonas sp. GY75]|uniref:hypothetical protein n=1 Tax=Dysgonomonas sp. GY75 TaxID=2780419 RepID=UPI00188328DF|nr:hypothetical protein [Dysgonomonas sp. GY75]MBF0651306.1 hypothetical protein [Dysgonomonas sp. GY75]
MTKTKEECCGNCIIFRDEDINGDGWCEYHLEPTHCSSWCEDGLFNSENSNSDE